ncbi:MAG: dihydrofolate reductase [Ahniella sp.]|nr:dihydrofolate reductase [Ahniella sp.]
MTELRLIAALDRRFAIGIDNRMPWHLPDDLKRFKALTQGSPVLMGRKTAESLGRALPKRRNLVLSRERRVPFAGMESVASVDEALALTDAEVLWVIGGGEVYRLCLERATTMALTHVDTELTEADAWFPAFDPAEWRVVNEEARSPDAAHTFAFRFVDYVRRCAAFF